MVAPASTLHNWQQEVSRFVPPFKVCRISLCSVGSVDSFGQRQMGDWQVQDKPVINLDMSQPSLLYSHLLFYGLYNSLRATAAVKNLITLAVCTVICGCTSSQSKLFCTFFPGVALLGKPGRQKVTEKILDSGIELQF